MNASHRFFVARSLESLKLRRSRATFSNFSYARHVPEDVQGRGETFCCIQSPPALRQSQSSFLSSSSAFSTDIKIQGWMYWARKDDSHSTERYTKVYAFLRNEFLLLYRNNQCSSKKKRPQPLVQIAVASSWCSANGVFHVEDPYGEAMELHLYERQDVDACQRWTDALEQAAQLTHSHFSSFNVQVDKLSRGSVYRGTLHDFRLDRESSIRRSVTHIKHLKSWRQFLSAQLVKYSRPS